MSNSHPPESRDTDTTVEGLYSVFHDGPCGKHYRQWEQCVELCRKANDIQNLDTRCPVEASAVDFRKCMVKNPATYGHLVLPNTPESEVDEGLSNLFAVLYTQCTVTGKCGKD